MKRSEHLEIYDFFKTIFLREFEAPGAGIFKTLLFLRDFEQTGTRTFFQNLKFPKSHVPSIQIELILS